MSRLLATVLAHPETRNHPVPFVQIHLVAGRDPTAVQQCMKEVARAVHDTLGAPLQRIRVIVNEVPANQWLIGDRTREEVDAAKRGAGT